MTMLRAVRARASQSLALFAIGVLLFGGSVAAVGYSRAAEVSSAPAGALLLLGGVAIAAQCSASVQMRRQEIALAELRGRHGLTLLRAAVAEPTLILVAAAIVGTAFGWVLARVCVRQWLGADATLELTVQEWATPATVLIVSVGVAVAVSWRETYQPLTAKLDSMAGPRPATVTGLFLSLLVLIGALVAVYQSRRLGAGQANWVSFLSPALVGLAAGQAGVWLVVLLSRVALRSRSLNRRLRWFLTTRRFTRRPDTVALIRIVVAAVAVAGIAGSAWSGSEEWRDEMARVQVGGPVAFAVPTGGLQAYVASHRADPEGRWLMAMSASTGPVGGSYRDVFIDSPRWDRVVGSFFSDTRVSGVTSNIGAIAPYDVVSPARGNRFSVTFTAGSVRRTWPTAAVERLEGKPFDTGFSPLQFTIRYVDDEGGTQVLEVPSKMGKLPTPVRPGVVGYSKRITGCSRACAVETVAVQGLTRDGPLRVTAMAFGDMSLLPLKSSGLAPVKQTGRLKAVASQTGLHLTVIDPYTVQPLLFWRSAGIPAALVTPGLPLETSQGEAQAKGPDGESRPVRVAADVAAVPLLGREGILLDLGTALRGAGGQIPQTQTLVVARADTPSDVLDALASTGVVGTTRTLEQSMAQVRASGTARGTQLYALVAIFGLSIAAVSVMATTARQRTERRREAASLRVVGVPATEVAGGYRAEAQALGVAITVVTAIAVWIGCWALLGALPLVDPGQFGLPFEATPDAGLVLGLAVASGSLVGLAVFLGLHMVAQSSPPSMLRDDAG